MKKEKIKYYEREEKWSIPSYPLEKTLRIKKKLQL